MYPRLIFAEKAFSVKVTSMEDSQLALVMVWCDTVHKAMSCGRFGEVMLAGSQTSSMTGVGGINRISGALTSESPETSTKAEQIGRPTKKLLRGDRRFQQESLIQTCCHQGFAAS